METSTEATPQPSESYEELESPYLPPHVSLSPEVDRLVWEFKGTFPSAISVMSNDSGAQGHLEPFFKPADATDDQNPENTSTGTYHPIALLPMTDPPASLMTVASVDLDSWEKNWVESHEWHSQVHGEFVTYGDLDDDIRPWLDDPKEEDPYNWEADSDTEFLIKCCGEDRPVRTWGRRLKVTPGGAGGFVTIRDYICAVHTWLISMRDDVLKARGVRQYDQCDASHPEFEWMVTFYDDEPAHWLVEKTEWVRNHCPLSQDSIDAANAMLRSLGSSGDVVNVVNVPVGGMGIRTNPGGEGQEETTEGQEERETELEGKGKKIEG
ncbi:hypothetical protein GE21DRAFT_5408 [Neurospora crassa]|uniref:Uncharacterized protein n=1 Tax=Neurospora crassa (strain ATCC 24698 / 74-OR23-1A / CBS 708.71 / DSM 1257 / FGSC 987) TaxID=367110 RepID=Q7S3R8_NEUCR|nr:hypothetical protein NCU04949 [Neurospora crassa OR74A]EAA30161.2 hypothetical protein NCU04949 [Neurospora crassa OR74A]KHE81588.1 hypothetical protein GE21DRAFT_5408 [Neurospora crassa]|eukprot:XP_959397.2 hypothetical protein NCU04949 [Neurospora crassa OR74A]